MRKYLLMLIFLMGLLVLAGRASCAETPGDDSFKDKCLGKCLEKGWEKVFVDVAGLQRQFLWKGPAGPWKNGAIIVLHGGGGDWTNWCYGVPPTKPMIDFCEQAIARGFAVFALDSTDGLVVDVLGNSAGKRFDCIARDDRPNIDLPFIEHMLEKSIQGLRPVGSVAGMFITGISNGGFMTILAATYFDDKITAFAPVSAGDPYGTYLDQPKATYVREKAPGVFRDSETHKIIGEDDAAEADSYFHEKTWHTGFFAKKPFFKQFHNLGDAGVDISCMRKAQRLLVQHGYRDDGPYIIQDKGRKRLLKHFWMREYSGPLLKFFLNCRNKD